MTKFGNAVDSILVGPDPYLFMVALTGINAVLVLILILAMISRIYKRKQEVRHEQIIIDPVTGGMNNDSFQMNWNKLEEGSRSECAIVFLNIVNFKLVNGELGIRAGNEILAWIYCIIQSHLEKGEFAGRCEMDHFFLCVKEQDREKILKRIEAIETEINTYKGNYSIHGQIRLRAGICMYCEHKSSIEMLQDCARVACQKAASSLGQKYLFYDTAYTERLRREQELDHLFEGSIINRDFQVFLQAKVKTQDGSLNGAEALVRWIHPSQGMIYPSEFIPLFERNGKISRLDLYVFEEVCRILAGWEATGKKMCPISVNISRHNYQNPDFLEEYNKKAEAYGISKELIEFELTESIFLEDEQIEQIKQSVVDMHRMGFRCALDDFGSGFSSLNLLKEFDVDTLKLDRRFFVNMSGEKAKCVIQCIIDLAEKLHINTVAEGIETEEQLSFLKMTSCEMIQGYIFSEAVSVEAFEKRWIT